VNRYEFAQHLKDGASAAFEWGNTHRKAAAVLAGVLGGLILGFVFFHR